MLIIYASEDCGKNWRIFQGYTALNGLSTSDDAPGWVPTSNQDWGLKQISLSKYSTSTNLMIKFVVNSQIGNSVFLDDIKKEMTRFKKLGP